ncbi:ABC transporter permease [Marichromatium purpuratum 984]|uniref:ABC transporter permease n=1 Tax=Marichromatium purpuratum 984 TaxID=765910 RepID=W0E049_MARPU|nr:ABC transporter permease [Marichromatium purpuratum 984]
MTQDDTERLTLVPWRTTYQRLLSTAGEHARGLRTSLLGLVVAAVLQGLALACMLPLFVVLLRPQPEWSTALAWLGGMTALAVLATVVRWRAMGFDFDGRMSQATHALRLQLGEQLRRMPLERLQDKRTGELSSMLLGNVDENLNYALTVFNMIAGAVVTPLVAALVTLWLDWRVGLILLLVFPAIVPLYRRRRPAQDRDKRRVAAAHSRTYADILEYTQGLAVLRAACCEGEKAERLQESFAHLRATQDAAERAGAKPAIIVASVVELGLLLVVAAGTTWVVMGSLDLAVLAAVMVMVVRFAEPLANFITFTKVFSLIEAALERIEALLAIEPLAQQTPERIPEQYDIRFEGVSFTYAQSAEPVIQGIDAELAPCSLTALVGPSGSGKTTLTRLLMRHADAQAGRVSIGGVDVRAIPPKTLNGLISAVFQDVYLFDDTVRDNIRMARPSASDAEVEAAARAAQCLSFIERLPQGWDTRLGEIGGRLSGGERQRISIARALLKDAPIVVLDEPTAALDTESEVAVQRAIDALVRAKTVIVIAHRLSTIAAADRILVIEDGRLVEQGRHQELLDAAGRYRSMWDAQQATKDWHLKDSPLPA